MPLLRSHKPLPIIVAMAVALLTACGPVREETGKARDPDTQVRELVARGQLDQAARLLNQLAARATPPARQDYLIKLARLLLRLGRIEAAARLLQGIDVKGLPPTYAWRLQLLQGRVALRQRKPAQALQRVPPLPIGAPLSLRLEAHRLRARAYTDSGNLLEAARERILLDPLLRDDKERLANSQAIWSSLSQLSALALQQLRVNPPPDILSGWLELAWLIKKARLAPDTLEPRVREWRLRYPNHPADRGLLAILLAKQKLLQQRPAAIAVLLPLSGPWAPAARAILNGFLVAHFNNRQAVRTTRIRIYDSWPWQKNIRKLYDKAVAEGARVVVGPLSKQAVAGMAAGGPLPTPVLALNIADFNASAPKGLYQFGLAPEDEARQVAERAALEGRLQAVVMVPRNDWGRRILEAFSQRYAALGGEVLESARYFPADSDFSGPIKRLFNIDESQARLWRLKRITGRRDIRFEPRRRQDIDMIFIAARPRQARLIVPQIRFHRGGGIPVYATSHAWNGVRDPAADRDMNGVIICDSPWTLSAAHKPGSLHQLLSRYWPDALRNHLRLYAFGIDAYNIVPYLEWLREQPYERFPGETGSLYVDNQGRVLRRLQWARFSGGIAQLIKQPVSIKPDAATPAPARPPSTTIPSITTH